ncbi:MAG: hypothetical protein M3Y82_01880 [Verrucomicrobiota bacterium]|nr:hypothetical protein [Verrucomicrobiota bacterium]
MEKWKSGFEKLDLYLLCNTFSYMSDILAKSRSVRFSKKLDRSLTAEAARQNVTVSNLIRAATENAIKSGQECAGDWCLGIAQQKTRRKKSDPELIAAYERRHQ